MKKVLIRWWHLFIYKPGTNKLYWEKIISSIVVLLAFGIWAYFNQTKVNRLKKQRAKYGKYSVGTTTGSYNNVKGGRKIHYKYTINNVEYSERNRWPLLDNSVLTKGGHYLVRYDSTNPANVEMLFKCPVPSYLKVPENGWLLKPFDCDEKKY